MLFIRTVGAAIVSLLFMAGLCLADDSTSTASTDSAIASTVPGFSPKVSGYGQIIGGQFVHGQTFGEHLNHCWTDWGDFGLLVESNVGSRGKVRIGGESVLSFSYAKSDKVGDLGAFPTKEPSFMYYPTVADGSFTFVDSHLLNLNFDIGYFPYKYNPDVRNLGEYLFRTRAYPQYIQNQFDFPERRLFGINLSTKLFDNLKEDFLLTSEVLNYPLMDWSFSYLVSGTLFKVLEIGGGVNFDRLLPAREDYTTPSSYTADVYVDPVTFDTTKYTFQSTKLMVRANLNLRPIISTNFLGEKYGIYGEVAVLGVKNYPGYYDTLSQRIPIMVGFNFPTFRLLDVAALELEFFNNPYPNSWEQIYRQQLPIPEADPNWTLASHHTTKWSFYISRNIGRMFTVTAQVAQDHQQVNYFMANNRETADPLANGDDWWWCLKTTYQF